MRRVLPPRSTCSRLTGLVALALFAGVAACSAGESDIDTGGEQAEEREDATESVSAHGDPGDGDAAPQDSGSEEPDYENDAGEEVEEFEYTDAPPPAEENSATLCNLNQEYFTSLRAESDSGDPVVDENLRLAVLTTDDNLMLWESLRSHFPEYDAAIDAAWLVRNHWDDALLNQENGNENGAQTAMREAEANIGDLPVVGVMDSVECEY